MNDADKRQLLIKMMYKTIKYIEAIQEHIEQNNLQNEQEVIDWLDKLNELSIKW